MRKKNAFEFTEQNNPMTKRVKIGFGYQVKNEQMLFHLLVDFEVDIQSLLIKFYLKTTNWNVEIFITQNNIQKDLFGFVLTSTFPSLLPKYAFAIIFMNKPVSTTPGKDNK